jgi:hypothetical protein
MLGVGYYPGDHIGSGGPNNGMARALTMGMLPPLSIVYSTVNASSSGALNGSYQWCTAFRRLFTGAQSNPSAATRADVNTPGTVVMNKQVSFSLPVCPTDPMTGSPDTNVVIDVYRFGGLVNRWAYVGTGTSGASFTDNTPDAQILSAPAPSQVVDPVTGLSRFNLFMPFPVADIGTYNTTGTPGTLTKTAQNTWTVRISSISDGFQGVQSASVAASILSTRWSATPSWN